MLDDRKIRNEKIIELYKSGLVIDEVAEISQISRSQVYRTLKAAGAVRSKEERYGQMKRPTKSKLLNTEQMIDLYVTNKLSCKSIAERAGISDVAVKKRLKRAGIVLRRPHESRERHVEISEELIELIDGLLLGDGCITEKSPRLSINQRASMIAWLDIIAAEFETHCLTYRRNLFHREPLPGDLPEGRTSVSREDVATLDSHAYVELRAQRLRWYQFEKNAWTKTVPMDVRLTPHALVHWYCGDGSLINDKGYWRIKFSTNGFTEIEVRRLSSRLNELYDLNSIVGFHADARPILCLNRQTDVSKFVSLVEPLMPKCFQYKIRSHNQ